MEQRIDKQFMLKVVNKTTAYNGKKMLRNEIEGLVHYIKEINFDLMKNDPPALIIDKIAKNFIKQLSIKTGSIIDTHEVMKRHIGGIKHGDDQSLYGDVKCPPFRATYGIRDPSILGLNADEGQNSEYDSKNIAEGFGTKARNTDEDTRNIVPQKVQNLYLLLDSKYRNLSTDDSVFKWTISNTANTTQGSVNTLVDNIHNIINIQFDRFNIPYVKSADNVYRKISMFIEEFSSMAVVINSNRRYHMIYDSDIQGNQIQLTPLINDEGRFRFHNPVNFIDTISIKFQSPFSPVVFKKDRYNILVSKIDNNTTKLEFKEQHGVSDGELVHIDNFNTLDPIKDADQIANINREEGHIVTFIDNFVLNIEADITLITPGDYTSICFIATRRLIIPIRMEYLM